MKLRMVCILTLCGTLAPSVFAQRRAPVRSPEIDEDGKVTFRLRAGDADAVEVAGQWPEGRAPMLKGEDDVWQVTVGRVPPGVWEYIFRVDGISMIDPGNHAIKPMRSPRTSILHLPGNQALVHDFQDVPHGTVHLHNYRSVSMGGGQSLTIGLYHSDTFAWVGGFSASVPRDDTVSTALDDPDETNERLELLWIGCGKDDFLLSRNEVFIDQLKEKGIESSMGIDGR